MRSLVSSISIATLTTIFLVSCRGLQPGQVEVTREVPQTVVVTEMVVVTATPVPATSTPLPTATPEFHKWTASQAADAIEGAGLEFENARPMVPDDYGLAPMNATEAIRFLLPSLCPDCGGRVYSFASQEEMDRMEEYYVELGRASAAFFSWVFTHDNVLIQINGDLPETRALQYQEAIRALD